jgi:hypothetical protein
VILLQRVTLKLLQMVAFTPAQQPCQNVEVVVPIQAYPSVAPHPVAPAARPLVPLTAVSSNGGLRTPAAGARTIVINGRHPKPYKLSDMIRTDAILQVD